MKNATLLKTFKIKLPLDNSLDSLLDFLSDMFLVSSVIFSVFLFSGAEEHMRAVEKGCSDPLGFL